MKQSAIVFLILIWPLVWLLFRPRFAGLRARLSRAARIAFVVYFLLLAVRFAQYGVDDDQLTMAGISLLIFGGIWVAAWLVTRNLARTR